MILRLKLVIILFLIFGLNSCGYQLAGTGTAKLPAYIKTITIPVFENRSQEPTIQRNLTTEIRKAFITDGRLKVVNHRKANLLMKGVLTKYYIRAVAFDTRDVATEYWVYLTVDIKVLDQVKNRPHLNQTLNVRWDYRPGNDVINAEAARQAAFDEAYRVLSIRLVSLVNDKF